MNTKRICELGGQGFLDALDKDPYDSATRLIFSDWLEEKDLPEESDEQRYKATEKWIEADKWLHEYAARVKPYDTESVYGEREDKPTKEGIEKAFKILMEEMRENELYYHGTDLHRFSEVEEPDILKEYAEVWLRKDIDWNYFTFSCSC